MIMAPALLAGGLALWARSLGGIDLRAMDDLGLVSVLPAPAGAGIALMVLGFGLAVRRPDHRWALVAGLGALVVVLYGTTVAVGEAPRGPVVWRHAGVAETLARTGTVDPTIDAYFNWPGFFTLTALLTELGGMSSAMAMVRWTPVYSNLVLLAALAWLYRTATPDPRLRWLALGLFALTNWVNQDYYAPQTFALLLFVVVVAVLRQWFTPTPPPAGDDGGGGDHAGEEDGTVPRAALMGIVVLMAGVVAASHQLTPFAMTAALAALVLVRRCAARGLPLLVGVLTLAWLAFMAVAYLKGHLPVIAAEIGDLTDVARKNVADRVAGSPEHRMVVRTRLAVTAALWLLAAVGTLRLRGARRTDLGMVALGAAPFPLLALQPYGGEMLLRVYLFSLPFVCYLAAAAFLPSPAAGRSAASGLAVAGCTLVLAAGFLVSRYGNERMDQYTGAEVEAVEAMYGSTRPGGLLVAGAANLPWKSRDYERYDYLALATTWPETGGAAEALAGAEQAMRDHGDGGAALILTRSQAAYTDLLGLLPPGALEELERMASASPDLEVAHRNRDAVVFVLAPEPAP
ncbi:MAG TPA: hypothetical protein VFO65_04525 [Acidimicrobiales bacterium]|nr:hypothetical protein [Acidimicrobiales bacterium]